jgi:putative transposase
MSRPKTLAKMRQICYAINKMITGVWSKMAKRATEIKLSEKQQKILRGLESGRHSPVHLKQRAQIVLLANAGNTNNAIEREMRIGGEKVTRWRNRYSLAAQELSLIESEKPKNLKGVIIKTLSDAARPGAPSTFTDEQAACIILLSCELPEKLGLPFSHWTPSLLREEAIRKGIVDSISTTQISRFLKRKRFKTTPNQKLDGPSSRGYGSIC